MRYADAAMDSDPETIGNIVLHPGDTLAWGPRADTSGVSYVRLLDRNGVAYAVLDCERDVADHGWIIRTIRWVGERGVLPVRPVSLSERKPQPQYHPSDHPGGDTTTYTITVPVDPGRPDLYATAVVHAHLHWHPDFRPGERGNARHSHPHPHSGTDVHRASLSGHDDDPHEHPHS